MPGRGLWYVPATERLSTLRGEGACGLMRLRSRREEDEQGSPEVQVSPESGEAPELASRRVDVIQPTVEPSKRLHRVAEHFQTQLDLVTGMRQQFEAEMEPLRQLLVDQATSTQQIMDNLEELLRPLKDYADSEDANLDALEKRMDELGADHIARSFSGYLSAQRSRITDTREQIDRERMPFIEYAEEQRAALEVALSRFDGDMDALEANLNEQRKVMMGMLESMRSETFSAVKQYLVQREEALATVAESGSIEPDQILRAVQPSRQSLDQFAADPHIRAVLERAEQADQHLVAATSVGGQPTGVPTHRFDDGAGASEQEQEHTVA